MEKRGERKRRTFGERLDWKDSKKQERELRKFGEKRKRVLEENLERRVV